MSAALIDDGDQDVTLCFVTSSDDGDDELVTLTVKTVLPEVDKQPDALVEIGEQKWRVSEPKVVTWMPVIKAARENDIATLMITCDDFLRDCMPAERWRELLRYVKDTDGLDQEHLIGAARRVAMHYTPGLEKRASSLGMALADDDAEDQDEPAPRPVPVNKTAKRPPGKKSAKRG